MYDVMQKTDRRYWIVQDGKIIGETADYKEAVFTIKQHQKHETHYMLRSTFSIIDVSAQEFVSYDRKDPYDEEAERAINEREAEYGADGWRIFHD